MCLDARCAGLSYCGDAQKGGRSVLRTDDGGSIPFSRSTDILQLTREGLTDKMPFPTLSEASCSAFGARFQQHRSGQTVQWSGNGTDIPCPYRNHFGDTRGKG